jgi:hypothetical protein
LMDNGASWSIFSSASSAANAAAFFLSFLAANNVVVVDDDDDRVLVLGIATIEKAVMGCTTTAARSTSKTSVAGAEPELALRNSRRAVHFSDTAILLLCRFIVNRYTIVAGMVVVLDRFFSFHNSRFGNRIGRCSCCIYCRYGLVAVAGIGLPSPRNE